MNKKEAFRELAVNRLENLSIARDCSFIEKQYVELAHSWNTFKNIHSEEAELVLSKIEAKLNGYREQIKTLEEKSKNLYENLDLFMDQNSDTHNMVVPERPSFYNDYLLALENQLPEKLIIKEFSAADFFVEKGIYSIIKNNDGEYAVATLKNNGDISIISKKTYEHVFQARNVLEHYFEKIKASGKVTRPLYVGSDDMFTLAALAKIGDHETFKKIKNDVSSETIIKSIQKEPAVNQAYDILKNGVAEFFNCGKYKEYLETLSHFHNYSFKNTILIAMQKPEATRCAGKTTWAALGRYIKPGAKGIRVFAPNIRKMTDEEKKKLKMPLESNEKIITSFRVANVFDISDTDGKELPTLCEKLSGDVKEYDKIITALQNVSGIKIQYADIPGEANGFFRVPTKEIFIRKGMSKLQSLKTAIHETAHSLFDDPDSILYIEKSDRFDKEVRAESVAFMVSNRLGLDTSEYSFPYIASWSASKTSEELEKNMKYIIKGMNTIVEGVNKELHLFETDTDIKNMVTKTETTVQNVSAATMTL